MSTARIASTFSQRILVQLTTFLCASCPLRARQAGARRRNSQLTNASRSNVRTLGPLVIKAGKPVDGVLLRSARLASNPAVAGGEIGITLSIKNVSQSQVEVLDDELFATEVWLRDETGRPAKLGPKGIALYGAPMSNSGPVGHAFNYKVLPGCGIGFDFPLSTVESIAVGIGRDCGSVLDTDIS